ncbi:MAG: hypothetical protein RLZZ272_1461 [Actinomycetota bacterium]
MSGLAERIARSIPGAGFELETLVRLVGIEETDAVPTAAVTNHGRSRLLVNPRFVAEHCRRDEHLYLLVMHELWHVLLAHTTLYRDGGMVHNLAFDAIINAGLSRQHPEPAYRGFFESTNPADEFPGLLLRPPVGWPDRPTYPDVGPPWVRGILKRLYPKGNGPTVEPTYDELIGLLEEHLDRLTEEALARVTLLGDHGGHGGHGSPGGWGAGWHGRDPLADPLLGEVLRRVTERWPDPPAGLADARERGGGGPLDTAWIARRPVGRSARAVFADAVRRAVEPHRSGATERSRRLDRVTVGPGPLPNAADRTLVARRRLVGAAVLPNQQVTLPLQRPDVPQRALVYLDVSGSMDAVLPGLIDLLAGPARRGLITVRQFSTEVAPIAPADLAAGRLETTGGTDIACVLDDALARPERRVLLVTDGAVGRPRPEQLEALAARRVRVLAVVPEDGWPGGLTGWCEVIELPVRMDGSAA